MSADESFQSVLPGAQLGPYSIETRLGAGGMGEVFRARDTRLGRTVAIKVIRPEYSQRADFHHRFEREARAISALNHPHVCSLYDVGELDGFAYLVMEYVEGATLAEVLRKGLLPLQQSRQYAVETADAVAAAHAVGIVHRDLKPANIMITAAGVKVLDFGLAKRVEPVDDDAATRMVTGQTQVGEIVGTLTLSVARAGRGQDGGSAIRYLFAGRRVLRDVLRNASLSWR